jgi:DNA-binding NarL/FixJ family response regulator
VRRVSSPAFVGRAEELAAFDSALARAEQADPVVLLVADGRTNRQIGEQLFISEKTASVHVSRILAKLHVGSRGEAAAVAHRVGLIHHAAEQAAPP